MGWRVFFQVYIPYILNFRFPLFQFPGIGGCKWHSVPLKSEAGLRGAVLDKACRSIRYWIHRFGFGFVAAAGHKKTDSRQYAQFFLHNFSYSSEAQMKGPTPFGSFSTIFSLI